MPTIEVSAHQAAALARGENITIKPEHSKRTFLAITPGKAVVLVEDARPRVGFSSTDEGVSGRFKVIWSVGPEADHLAGRQGYVGGPGSFPGSTWDLIEVSK